MNNKLRSKNKRNLSSIKSVLNFFRYKKLNRLIILLIILLSIYITNYNEFPNINAESVTENGPDPEIYFCGKDNCTKIFLNLIEESNEVKCVLYDLDIPEIIDALKEKNAEVYLEEDNALDEFESSYSTYLMHNKFCVFDNETIMTGSFNPTNNGAYKNNNNVVVIKSKYLTKNYKSEFEEIKNEEFGKGEQVKYPVIKFNNYTIQNYFCPEDNCQKHVIDELNKAEKSIVFMTFSFTDTLIADKLIQKNLQGINVEGVTESKRTNMKYNVYKQLTENNVTMYKDTNPYNLHHKVFIIDDKTVITGSYNPTKAGTEKNDENILIIENKEIAAKYLEEYLNLTLTN